jgi:hypothetical protein
MCDIETLTQHEKHSLPNWRCGTCRCGVLQEGDHILAINGQYLEGRTIDEVEQFIAESPVKMLLTVEFRVAGMTRFINLVKCTTIDKY